MQNGDAFGHQDQAVEVLKSPLALLLGQWLVRPKQSAAQGPCQQKECRGKVGRDQG